MNPIMRPADPQRIYAPRLQINEPIMEYVERVWQYFLDFRYFAPFPAHDLQKVRGQILLFGLPDVGPWGSLKEEYFWRYNDIMNREGNTPLETWFMDHNNIRDTIFEMDHRLGEVEVPQPGFPRRGGQQLPYAAIQALGLPDPYANNGSDSDDSASSGGVVDD